jgi:hypothetical protein
MSKYLLPWKKINDNDPYPLYIRGVFGKGIRVATVWEGSDGLWYGILEVGKKTKEETMIAVDKRLTEQGYTLIPEDQVERFEKKLKLLL